MIDDGCRPPETATMVSGTQISLDATGHAAAQPNALETAVAKLDALKAEHAPIVSRIAADRGIEPATRELLLSHLMEEETELMAKISALTVDSTAATKDNMGTNPLSDSQHKFISDEIVREARRTLVGRRFLGIYGPLGAGIESIRLEQYGPDRDAEIELYGKSDTSPIVAEKESFLRVPILYKDFVLHWRDVELSRKLGAPIDATKAVRAAHFVADREDELIFNGDERFGIHGLLNVPGRSTVSRSDWSKYGNPYRDVVLATEKLLADNHHRPFALAVSAGDYARLVQQREGQFAPELDAISRLCDDGVYTSPAIPDGKAVLLSTGDQNFDIAITEDLTMTFLGERDQDYPFRVYECLVLRIKRAKAICTIE